MKIAIFADTIDIRNGYGNIAYEYCRCLQELGVDFTLFIPRAEKHRIAELGLTFPVRAELPNHVFRLYQGEGWKYLLKAIDILGHTLVHAPFSYPYCIPALRAAKRAGIPFIIGAQGTYGVLPLTQYPEKWLLRRAYDKAAAIAVPSTFTADSINKYAGRSYAIDIIHNGVRFMRFAEPVDTSALKARFAGKRMLLTVGGLKARKGQDLVIRALPQILQKFPDAVYVLVGEGSSRTSLEKLAKECGVQDSVVFEGSKTGDELVSYFQACDIYVHTPKVVNLQFEGFGIVYLEAAAAGKPTVATDAGGIRDAVLDEKTGLIAKDGDIDGIAEKILRLLTDPSLAAKLGLAGKSYAQSHDWPVITKQYLSLYQRIHG